ncbi:MAG: hypothetical protein LAT62_08010 [Natronospirillum sp.]|uniref:hypothetical protein n=1 Tax=Natronospirillum sp. TaxID=2812955 RepID=UPI0025ED0276|nr:hypothetical protein [Natronospirillum sp.]MCH8551865.1 hypothetical protein [Natronospirillum sp.]
MKTSAALEVETTDSLIAIDFLVDNVNLSKSRLKKLMNAGGVWLRRGSSPRYRLRRAMSDLKPGDVLEVYYDEALLEQPIRQSHLVKDNDIYSVWQKPAGVFCMGSDWGDHNCLDRQVELYFHKQRPAWPLTLVPAAARGLVMVSHHKRASARFLEHWESGEIQARWRLLLSGDQRARLQKADGSASPLVAAACSDAGLSDLSVQNLEYQAGNRSTRLDVSGGIQSVESLLRWAAAMEVSLPCAGESVPAAELLLPTEEGDESRLELAPVELLALQFECPFSGVQQAFAL